MATLNFRAHILKPALWFVAAAFCLNHHAYAQSNFIFVEISGPLAAKPSTAWSEAERQQADSLFRQKLAERPQTLPLSEADKQRLDAIVVFTHHGQPLLPEREKARRLRAEKAQDVANELTFTFNSSSYPWTAAELEALRKWLNDFYPTAKALYGNPAFNLTVNVRRDPTISFAGLYFASSNEMLIKHEAGGNLVERQDVIVHEMIHAFRDDYMIDFSSYEEGMTRAAEVAVFQQLPQYPRHWDANHSYPYDVYYDGLNEPAIATKSGRFFSATGLTLLRYQLSGYAWAKAYLENAFFFVNFNQSYYAQMLVDPGTSSEVDKLKNLVRAFAPSLEQKDFEAWYEQQFVLGLNPPSGYVLYQRINQYTVDYFFRDADLGNESPQTGASVQWAIYDYTDARLDSGSVVTNILGVAFFYPSFPNDYTGRIKVVTSTNSPAGPIQEISYRSHFFNTADEAGVFGIIPHQTSGTVLMKSLDDPAPSATQALANGAFSFPQFEKIRGRFELIYTAPDGRQFQRYFTKDASHYFIDTVEPRGTPCLSNGDVNGDGVLTPGDALCAFRIYLNSGQLPADCDAPNFSCEVTAADVNCEGVVTPGDALAIFMRYLKGLPPDSCFARGNNTTKTTALPR